MVLPAKHAAWYRGLSRKWRYALWIYGVGAVLTATFLLYDIYDSGGFQRSHTVSEFLFIAGVYLTTTLLWPVLVVIGLLQYFRLVPMPITF